MLRGGMQVFNSYWYPIRAVHQFATRPYSVHWGSSCGFDGLLQLAGSRWRSKERLMFIGYPIRMENSTNFPSVCWLLENDYDVVESRKRINLVELVNHNMSLRRSNRFKQKQSRLFSSKSSEVKNDLEKESAASSKKIDSFATKPTDPVDGSDPDFASYLSSETKPPSHFDSYDISQMSTSSITSQRRLTAAKRSRTFALDNDKELYEQIISTQIMQKEQSRLKTASNVYRALIGNVIICTGSSFCRQKPESPNL